MKEHKVNIHELIDGTMEALVGLGLSKHTVWGGYSDHYLPIGKFFKKSGLEHYDTDVLSGYIGMIERRLENKEIGRDFFNQSRKAVERLIEFYDTGKLNWTCRPRLSKFQISAHFESVLDGFLAAEEFHHNTRGDFIWVVRKYLAFMQQDGHTCVNTIAANDLQRFILFCAERLAGGSLHNIVCYLKRFHHYLQETGQLRIDYKSLLSFPIIRDHKIQPYLTWDEITRTMEQIDRSTDMGKRDYAMVLIGVRTGLRAIDIVYLRLKDIDWRTGTMRVLQQKTGDSLVLPLMADVGEALKEYILKARPVCESEYIFVRTKAPHQRLGDGAPIGDMFDSYQKKAGIERKAFDGKGFHALRRSIGRNMAITGVPVTTIAQVLGQNTMNAAKKYISLDSENLKICALDFRGIEVERGEMPV